MNGADGIAISGSGPAMFAVTDNAEKAEKIRNAMVSAFMHNGIKSESIITEMDEEGVRQL